MLPLLGLILTAFAQLLDLTRTTVDLVSRIPSELTVSIEDLYDTLHCTDSAEAELSANELGKLINQYIDTLSERQRHVFIGRFYMGDTLDEIAQQLNVHLSTVQRETVKIKKGLKAYLERNGEYV